MKVQLALLLASALAAQAAQIPFSPLAFRDDTQVNAEDFLNYINKINSESGILLGADRNNVTIHLGDKHISYRDGRLVLLNSTKANPDTPWQIRYDNKDNKNLASICAHVPSFTTRCWDAGSGSATTGGSRSTRYFPTTVGNKFVFWESNYCLTTSGDGYNLAWTYNSECTHFTVTPSHILYGSPRGLHVGKDGVSIQQHGASDGDGIDDFAHVMMWDPFDAMVGAVVKTIGSAINLVAPDSQAAQNARAAGDAWGYCGTNQPC